MRPQPPCFGQMGAIQCPCAVRRGKAWRECVGNRYFWIAAQTIADMRNNRARTDYLAMIGQTYGEKYRAELCEAAKWILAQRKAAA